jgi:hypothetical protein
MSRVSRISRDNRVSRIIMVSRVSRVSRFSRVSRVSRISRISRRLPSPPPKQSFLRSKYTLEMLAMDTLSRASCMRVMHVIRVLTCVHQAGRSVEWRLG